MSKMCLEVILESPMIVVAGDINPGENVAVEMRQSVTGTRATYHLQTINPSRQPISGMG